MSEEPTAVRIARLMASAPEAVFEELKADHRDWYRADTEELEAALTHRSHPLIDLALARYGRSQAVVAGLLEAGLEKPTDERDAMQLRGLRMSCFANERFDFGSQGLMQRVVSPEQAASIIATSDFSELVVLLRNPKVGDDTLAELFLGTGPFEGLEEERWLTMVQIAADNPRLMAPNDETHGPDFGYWNIHKALFQLVKKAPVTERWCFALLAALVRAHPPSVVIDEPIAGPLERWSGFEARDRKGEIDEGLYTDLTRGEEFRCLIASLYGTRWIDGKKVHAGSPLSPTLAERCAYYAGATLSKKDVETFAKKDGSGFGFAFIFNENAMWASDTRRAFEEHARYDRPLFRTRLEVIAREWPSLQRAMAQEDAEQSIDDPKGADPVQMANAASLGRLETQVSQLQKQLQTAGYALVIGAIILAWWLRR